MTPSERREAARLSLGPSPDFDSLPLGRSGKICWYFCCINYFFYKYPYNDLRSQFGSLPCIRSSMFFSRRS
jgi:hypothetical protein